MIPFKSQLAPGKNGYLIGIGGVSMSPLAEVLTGMGLNIHGSDIAESATVSHLRSLGIPIYIGHATENISQHIDFVVRTAAVHDDNPEIIAAQQNGIPIYERTQAWGAIMQDYENALCISGTHGKTTTTSMAAHILMAAERDPTIMIGGTLPLLSAGHRVGCGDTIVMESCEYYNSFHSFFPTIAVVLNIEADHLDFFRDLEDVQNSFQAFAALTPKHGHIIANRDDENTMAALLPLKRPLFTFGLQDNADVYAQNITMKGAQTDFDVIYEGKVFTHISLRVPGLHNVKNALAATAAAICLSISPTAISYGLSAFTGAGRRFEFKGKFNGADIYDDYAHHPGELRALIDAVKPLGYQRVVLVFQPHTFTRTKALMQDFITELRRADLVLLAEIYAAREKNTVGISSADLAKQIEGSKFHATFEELLAALKQTAQPGDLILTVGAGNIYTIGEKLIAENPT